METKGIIYKLLRRPITVFMVTLLTIGFGLFALANLKITLLPNIDIPVVAISANYRDVAPEDIKRILAVPIENAVASIDGVESIETTVRRGGMFLVMRLKGGTNAQRVEMDAREAIDRIRSVIPREAGQPLIFQFDPERRPIMSLSVSAANRGLDELRLLSETMIEPMFERIQGVASAETQGGLQRAIYVNLSPERMAQHRVVTADVERALSGNNVQIPIGNLISDRQSYSIRAEAIFRNIEEVNDTIIRFSENGEPIRLSDVGEALDTFVDITALVEVNGLNSVTIDIQKQSDANTLDVALDVINEIEAVEAILPPGVSLQVLNNEGEFIENSIRNLTQSAMVALALVALILFIFMGSYRAATIVAFSIPISMTATFAAMYFSGVTLNIISITGLALAVGLLVDNSIVVLDNIIAKIEKGEAIFEAVLNGTNEMKEALLGSTLTTLAVFIPIFFISGFTGQIAKDLALTISFAISLSFIASIILLPVFASKFLRQDSVNTNSFMFRFTESLQVRYERILRWQLLHKRWTVLLIFGILFGIGWLFTQVEGEFFPDNDTGDLIVDVSLVSGAQLTQTAEILRDITNRLLDDERVQTTVTTIGRSGWRRESNVGRVTVSLVPSRERTQTTDEVAMELRRSLTYDDTTIRVFGQQGFGPGGGGGGFGQGRGNITVSLIGPDVSILQGLTDRIETVMLQDSTVIAVDNPRVGSLPEVVYQLDRVALGRLGSSFNEAANSFKTQTRGTQVGQFRVDGREFPIEVRLEDQYRRGFENLNRLQVARVGEQGIPVQAVGFFEEFEGFNTIRRTDRETRLDVSIRVDGSAAAQRDRIMELFQDEIVLPDGYRYEFTGAVQDQQDSQRELFLALLAAIILTFMVMAAKFESIRDPFVILFTIPLAFFGAYLMLFATGTPFSIPAGIGMLILVGIVVNNGIVLVDYINQNTRTNMEPEEYLAHFLAAAGRRLRPVMLTMLTTIFSMIPLALAIGDGSETWSPLARAVIGGLFFASIFTLFVVPVIYAGISRTKYRLLKAVKIKEKSLA
ncbi:hydrophobic/amphiphilic exporter-1, HAE1 family [Cyclonatronum proteinivorum]|uniref:Hydrophobic/amphiphilic exporter-1, HAE1 family n=1 Tax=Cyclonatronum proteinivorum TaxID=1457365 RepID=A0A345UIJ2_9BACT|nr:efflux RND transporter permease subunit [Cyclonatronum proteinivorum]AXJ00294.1 hydrophobic/amphiphilic exporter-1, HAE1 family [Cyclonatronum proteinivorum]